MMTVAASQLSGSKVAGSNGRKGWNGLRGIPLDCAVVVTSIQYIFGSDIRFFFNIDLGLWSSMLSVDLFVLSD